MRIVAYIIAPANMLATRARFPADLLFRALSDATRLRILSLLQGNELCVGDLVTILRVPQAKTSRHLAYLRRTGLVVCRENGLWCFYSLAPARDPLHRKLMESLRACSASLPEIAKDEGRAARLRRSGGCCPRHGTRRAKGRIQ
jgi:ArsR family transcriptional regulator